MWVAVLTFGSPKPDLWLYVGPQMLFYAKKWIATIKMLRTTGLEGWGVKFEKMEIK